jgi:hypothetical protein
MRLRINPDQFLNTAQRAYTVVPSEGKTAAGGVGDWLPSPTVRPSTAT